MGFRPGWNRREGDGSVAAMHNPSFLPAWLTLLVLAMAGTAAPAPAFAAEAPPDAAGNAPPPSSDLPTVVVNQRPVHTVPEEDPGPSPPVTIKGRDGNAVALHAPRPPLVRRAPAPAPVTLISGAARLGEGISLSVRGRSVHLFGVRLPASGDRCGDAASHPCSELAREALAMRLRMNGDVSCRVPPGQRAAAPGAVCHDVTGVDLGGFLVAQGLALADPTQSYEYVGAESAARAVRRGLWNYR